MDIGIYTFADVAPGGSHGQRLLELVAEIELADQVGLDIFGDPDRVTDKIISLHRVFKQDRILIQMAFGAMPHKQLMRAIELLGTKVAPRVKEALQ